MGSVVLASGVKNWVIGGSGVRGVISILDENDNVVSQIGRIDDNRTGIILFDEDGSPIAFLGDDKGV